MTKKPTGLTFELSVFDRIQLVTILPRSGAVAVLRLITGLLNRVGLSAKEIDAIELVVEKNGVKWNPAKARPKTITFTGFEISVIVGALKGLDGTGNLTVDQLPLWDKFVGSEPDPKKEA